GGIFIDIGAGSYRNSAECQIGYSRIEKNVARKGGGIFNNGELLVYGSTIDSNTAIEKNTINSREGCGGGIFNGEGGQLFIYDCTISNNKADVDGGGIAAYRPIGTDFPVPGVWEAQFGLLGLNALIDYLRPPEPFTVYNSTIAYNRAETHYGGGIFTTSATGIYNCTIANNFAPFAAGLCRTNYVYATTDFFTIENTIIVNNSTTYSTHDYYYEHALFTPSTVNFCRISRLIVSDNSFDDLSTGNTGFIPTGELSSSDGVNSIWVPNPNYSGQSFGDSSINFIIANPHLGPLQNNGGPTFTMALLEHSPAIDKGNSVLSNSALDFGEVINRDQRGEGRVSGLGRFTDRDIGAFEYQPLATTAKLLTSTSTTSAASSLKVYDPVTDTTTDVEDPFPGFTGK
ncbi:MAG: choice-of-anchor Q domain-containing protein, partial [Planctomycetia bacterium]